MIKEVNNIYMLFPIFLRMKLFFFLSLFWVKYPNQHQMVNTEIRLIIFFAAKEGEALYSQQK